MQIDDWISHDIPEHIITQAADWIIQFDQLAQNDNSTMLLQTDEQLQLQFYQWLNNHQLHQMAFLQLAELWAKSSILKHLDHQLEKSKVLPFPTMHSSRSVNLEAHSHLSDAPDIIAAPAWMYLVVIGLMTLGTIMGTLVPLLF